MNRHIITTLAAVILLNSCSDKPDCVIPGSNEICIETSLDDICLTRTSFQTADGMKQSGKQIMVNSYRAGTVTEYFKCAAYFAPFADYADRWVFYNTDANMYDYKYYWPDATHNLDFFAYCPADLTNTCVTIDNYTVAGHPSFTCTNLPVTSEGQNAGLTEFIYAFETDKSQPASNDKHKPVGLHFHHPFARITFQLETAIRSTLNTVTITNIFNNGTFTYSDQNPSWAKTGVLKDFVVTSGLLYPEEMNNGAIIGGPYLIIPQEIGSNNYLEVNYLATGNEYPTTVSVGLRGQGSITSWEPGYAYTYKISLNGAANEVILGVSVEPWIPEGISESEIN